jgi:DNA polymerase I-like protein with 3'-5' exonuclease and polymerase domains
VNSAVQGSGADKLKAAMVLLHARLGDGAAFLRGACRLVHSVRHAGRC